MSRSYEAEDFANSHGVRLGMPLDAHDTDYFLSVMREITDWSNKHCRGDFLIMVNHVYFQDEKDALIFKLKFG